MKITFFSTIDEVTGSKYLIEHNHTKILVDCGLFQGRPEIKKHNWDTLPIQISQINALVLTHAHLDHTGYIPALVKQGFKGPIYCSQATYALCEILLKDSAMLQEEDAQKLYDVGHFVKPLYSLEDTQKALNLFQVVEYGVDVAVGSLNIRLIQSNHILGSSFVVVSDGVSVLTFSGDLARPEQIIMKSPPHIQTTDFLVLESTYGKQLHTQQDPTVKLAEVINVTVAKKGVLIIPAFAIGRTQSILYCLYQLRSKNIIPNIPIYLDSPMAISVTNLYRLFKDEHTLSPEQCDKIFHVATYVHTIQESKRLHHMNRSAIIIAGSGMADGGRVIDHLAHFISDPKNTVLFVGFQAPGTHGRSLIDGADIIELQGIVHDVSATIDFMDMFSAHADYQEILEWLSFLKNSPKQVFLTHGEYDSRIALKEKIEKRFGWNVIIPEYAQSFDLQ